MTGPLGRVSPELNLLTAFGFGVLGTLRFARRGRHPLIFTNYH